ncbi:EAL domain-containing protein [Pseudomonas oryzae]|uniref:EAL domain, c-di-GMP-specific phosphodiesterase class I (Or its enzymatically inactive variant) n=1 Tax=Pseudomonas oryzae TaxID=1392877 RepID=A0A1H1PAU9_9PSED|nr:EAL domain-containing protein [Pseudomonas oryzae]SDS08273.1 EAL domain, c-di-GMP-specific phosphodiesterase class I (or its enzymatically inactive variant) [Pseudomonas oryzae]
MYLSSFFADADDDLIGCIRCRDARPLGLELKMAFQPIVDVEQRNVFAYEALVRGADGASAAQVLGAVKPEEMYSFDQTCRVLAIETAQRLGMETYLSINFLPNAVYEPASCIRLTLAAARKVGFSPDRLIFELTESEKIRNPEHALKIIKDYRQRGFLTAIDDFGAGYSGLNLLAEFQPHIVKLDMALTRDIDRDAVRRAIVAGVIGTCNALGCKIIAEGIERAEELYTLREMGVSLFQGYLLARPGLESLPEPDMRYC